MTRTRRSEFLIAFALALLVLVGAVLSLGIQTFFHPPDFEAMKSEIEVKIKKADGTDGTRKMGPKTSDWTPLSQISNYALSAVISSEDTSFYSHPGIDVFELKESIKKDWKEKKWARGGSTITQQVVKNTFLTSEKTIWRKIKEMIYAYQLEKNLKKSQILEFYMNLVEWGPGIYGVRQASRTYFSKSPSELGPKESAFLALLLPSPRKYFSYFKNKELTKWASNRLDRILSVMHSMGYINDEEFEKAKGESLWGKTNYTSSSENEVDETEGQTFETPGVLEPVTPEATQPPPEEDDVSEKESDE